MAACERTRGRIYMCSSSVVIETPVIMEWQAPCTHVRGIIHQAQCQHGLQKEEVVHVERAWGVSSPVKAWTLTQTYWGIPCAGRDQLACCLEIGSRGLAAGIALIQAFGSPLQ